MRDSYDVIVIGGGHAGTEAACAAASALESRYPGSPSRESRFSNDLDAGNHDAELRAIMTPGSESRATVALITMDPSKIGTMSCNPAIGGLAKGQMVREIDALGGLMGLATDATGIMFRMLNQSKGAAVHGPRAECDKYAYAAEVQRLIATRSNIDVIAGVVDDVIVEDGRITGVVVPAGAGIVHADSAAIERNLSNSGLARPIYSCASPAASNQPRLLRTRAVVLTTGTFMRGLMHTGETKTAGGRIGEGSAVGISGMLRRLGFELGRLKTGTPPRLARESIDWDSLEEQLGDADPQPFSDMTPGYDGPLPHGRGSLSHPSVPLSPCPFVPHSPRPFPALPQITCRLTHTTAAMHELIRANLHRAPMYSGQIEADCGPRYCPSIEDKVVRFADKPSHHVFLEPESLHTNEVYCNGISTSLPADVQDALVHAMPGCERAKLLRWGYAVEYDMIRPHQIDATCMTKSIAGLFTAGQINGTSGYEEAGGQGLVAGLNAARLAGGDELVFLGRDQAYIGVMMDDLVTKTPREPYRMFTSRAEHRLLLRADNADERLTPLGRELGLVDDRRWSAHQARRAQLETIRELFVQIMVDGRPLRELALRPELSVEQIAAHVPAAAVKCQDSRVTARLIARVMTELKYAGYIARQRLDITRQAKAESQRIPKWVRFDEVRGLRAEAAEALHRFQPSTMGQAGRLAGVTPADLTILAVAIRRGRDPAPAAST